VGGLLYLGALVVLAMDRVRTKDLVSAAR